MVRCLLGVTHRLEDRSQLWSPEGDDEHEGIVREPVQFLKAVLDPRSLAGFFRWRLAHFTAKYVEHPALLRLLCAS